MAKSPFLMIPLSPSGILVIVPGVAFRSGEFHTRSVLLRGEPFRLTCTPSAYRLNFEPIAAAFS